MSKRGQDTQGGFERYGGHGGDQTPNMADKPTNATAAQLARRKIAQPKKAGARSSRSQTPTAPPNAFGGGAQPQQSMASFQTPDQSGFGGGGGGFNFSSAGNGANPFAQQNGASTPAPTFGGFNGVQSQPPQQNGTPAATPTFGGFGASTNQPQQNGGGGMFGAYNNAFGSNSAQQPQQNGFNPSTSTNMFGQPKNDNATPAPSFGGFGQNNQSQTQQNGLSQSTTSSFPSFGRPKSNDTIQSFGQSQQQAPSTPGTSFGGFGQQNGEKSTGASFSFGQSAPAQQNGDKSTGTSFGGFGQSAQPQTGGDKPLFSATSQAEQTPKPSTGGIFNFGQNTNNATPAPTFGASTQPEQTPKPKEGGMFGAPTLQGAEQTPKPQGGGLFGASTQPGASKPLFGSTPAPGTPAETPKPSASVFGTIQQKPISSDMFTKDKPKMNGSDLFGTSNPLQQNGDGPSTENEETLKANPFAGLNQQTPSSKPLLFQMGSDKAPSGSNLFGQKELSQPPTTGLEGDFSSAPTTTPGQGKSLFERISRDPPATAPKPSSNLFDMSKKGDETPSTSNLGKSMFDRTSRDEPAATPKPSFQPSTSLFAKPSDAASSETSQTPAAYVGTPAQQAPQRPSPLSQTSQLASSTAEIIPASDRDTFKLLNEGLVKHVATQDPNADWSSIFQYYLKQAASIQRKRQTSNAPTASPIPESSVRDFASSMAATTAPASKISASQSSAQMGKMFDAATPKHSDFQPDNMFASLTPSQKPTQQGNAFASLAQQTPKPSNPPSFANPPQTAPVNKKRSADDEHSQPQAPATEKRRRPEESTVEYPKLPDTASSTAKMFQAALDKPADKKKESSQHLASNSEHKAPSGMPSFAAPASGGFLSAFGKKASVAEEEAKKKRKLEDYDSDDSQDNEEEWEKRDAAKQEAKRKEILESAKSAKGFSFTSSNAEKASDKSTVEAKAAETPQGKSMFERVQNNPPATAPNKTGLFSQPTPGADKASSNMFGSKTPSSLGAGGLSSSNPFSKFMNADKGASEGEEGQSDKESGSKSKPPSTPFKPGGGSALAFGSTTPAAAPPLGNLFGTKDSNTPAAKPALNFNFTTQPASGSTSSAATPAATPAAGSTNDSAAADGDHAPEEPQVEDQTGLRDSEKEDSDLLFTTDKCKALKSTPHITDKPWSDRGKGPLYILRHKETGKVRVVLKVPPYGNARMNFAPLPGIQYAAGGKTGKSVTGAFVDHLDERDAGAGKKPSSWTIMMKSAEDAEELAKVLMENRPQ